MSGTRLFAAATTSTDGSGAAGKQSIGAQDIIQAILDGRQPHDLTANKLLAHSRLPLAWHDQRTALGFA
jgi:hypothetical protein